MNIRKRKSIKGTVSKRAIVLIVLVLFVGYYFARSIQKREDDINESVRQSAQESAEAKTNADAYKQVTTRYSTKPLIARLDMVVRVVAHSLFLVTYLPWTSTNSRSIDILKANLTDCFAQRRALVSLKTLLRKQYDVESDLVKTRERLSDKDYKMLSNVAINFSLLDLWK